MYKCPFTANIPCLCNGISFSRYDHNGPFYSYPFGDAAVRGHQCIHYYEIRVFNSNGVELQRLCQNLAIADLGMRILDLGIKNAPARPVEYGSLREIQQGDRISSPARAGPEGSFNCTG